MLHTVAPEAQLQVDALSAPGCVPKRQRTIAIIMNENYDTTH